MGKIYTRKFMLVIGALLLCIVLALLIRLLFSSRTIRMTLNPIEVEVGEPVYYSDSTRNAKNGFGSSATETSQTSKAGNIFLWSRDVIRYVSE